ncbi:MAG: hypothetical protein RLZZ403_173, partial [Pseudomonadota bacterium]
MRISRRATANWLLAALLAMPLF